MVLHREVLEKLAWLGLGVSLCCITLKSSKGACIKDHHPSVGGGDIVPIMRAAKAEACSGPFHFHYPYWNGMLNITVQISAFIKLYELL